MASSTHWSDSWLACPMCDVLLYPPDYFGDGELYEEGEPIYEIDREAACPSCGLLCRTDVDGDHAYVAYAEEYLNAGQGLCDGSDTCCGTREFLNTPCSWDCEKAKKSGWKPPAVPKCEHSPEHFVYVADGHRFGCKECECSAK